jgi:DNA polymerase elongation subunit (family B)
MKKRGEPVRVNDVIAYVVTGDGQEYNKNAAERAYSPQEVSKPDSNLIIGPSLFAASTDCRLQLLSGQTDSSSD